AALRMTGASALLWGWQLRSGPARRTVIAVPARDPLGMLAIGLFGGVLALPPSPASSLLVLGEVLFTAIVATFVFRERLGAARAAATLVGSAGVVILVAGDGLMGGRSGLPPRALRA